MTLDFKDIAYRTIETKDIKSRIIELKSARRHVVRINDIRTEQKLYGPTSTLKTNELIVSPVQSIAVFCSEYIPPHFPAGKYVKYIITANEKDYEVEPLNSHRPGKKIIKFSHLEIDEHRYIYLKESIKSAYLTIVITIPNEFESPLVSNIKILHSKGGDDHGNI